MSAYKRAQQQGCACGAHTVVSGSVSWIGVMQDKLDVAYGGVDKVWCTAACLRAQFHHCATPGSESVGERAYASEDSLVVYPWYQGCAGAADTKQPYPPGASGVHCNLQHRAGKGELRICTWLLFHALCVYELSHTQLGFGRTGWPTCSLNSMQATHFAPQYIKQFRIVLSIFKVSGPTIQRHRPPMAESR